MAKIGNLIFILFVFCGNLAFAKGVKVDLHANANEIGLDQMLTLTVNVSNDDDIEVEEPRSPDFDGFQLLNTWATTSNSSRLVQGPNGMQFESQKSKEFNYQLAPRKTGSYSIGSFDVVVNGKLYKTNSLQVRVLAQASQNNRKQQRQQEEDPFQAMQNAEDEIFQQLLKNRQIMLQQQGSEIDDSGGMLNPAVRTVPTNPNEAFFIQIEVDKNSVYQGEQITANWYVYTRGQMESLDRLKFPSLRGFWKEVIEEVPSIQFREEVINGIPYRKALLASHALFPIKAGTAVIDEFKIKSKVRTFSQGFGGYSGKPYEYTKSSDSVKIQVKEVPTENRPEDFSGAVGEFEIQSAVEGNGSYPVNQPFTLRLRFEGAGNAKQIELPALNLPPNLEVYDTKSDSKFFKNGRSFKEFEVLVIPRSVGDLNIPEIKVSFFNPKTGKFYTRSSLPITLKIIDNPNAPSGIGSPLKGDSSENKSLISKEPLNEMPTYDVQLEQRSGLALMNPWYWLPIFISILLGLLVKIYLTLGWGKEKRDVKDLVNKRLKKAQAFSNSSKFKDYSSEMLNTWYLVLGQASENQGSAIPVDKMLENLSPSLRREYADSITKSIDYYQMLCFAPAEMTEKLFNEKKYQEMDTQARQLISNILAKL